MPNKALMLGVAFAVAGLVLLLTVLIGGPGSGPNDQSADVVDPELFVPGPGASEQNPLGNAEGIVYEIKESGILFFADRIIPRTEGEIDAIDTSIRIHFAPGRELTIDADEGTIVAPDQHPQEGQMRGNVVVTLYETPDGSEVDFKSDQHVVIRMYFDDPVDFDLELQQIDSAGPIFMTGPQVQFRGRGLSLNYNQLHQRIQRLVIEEGESLHYIPESKAPLAPTAEADSADGSSNRTTKTGNKSAGNTSPQVTPDAPAPNTKQADHPVQYYLATFEQLNDVRVGRNQYVVEGDDLAAVFSTKAAGESDKPVASTGPGSSRITTPDYSQMLATSDPMSAAIAYALAANIGQTPDIDPRSLATFTDEDVVISWNGRLVVSPLSEDGVPEAVTGPDDVMVTVRGKPAKISTDQGETVRAPKISFFSLNAGLLAEGTAYSPVMIDAPDMGSLTGAKLAIDQTLGTGYILGPGSLTGQVRDMDNTADALGDKRPIDVSFEDRLNLAFYLKKQDAPKDDTSLPVSSGRIKGVKTADFLGNIHVDYAELDMTTDRLTLALLENAPEGDDKLAVESLSAIGNVEAFVKEENVRIYADRLAADPAHNQLELFGTTGTDETSEVPARVVRPDATLTGRHLVMDEKAGTVHVPGPGNFDFQPDPEDPGKTVHVQWVESMHYDDQAGTARFVGDVETLSVDGTDTNELMGNDLLLTFVKDESVDAKKADPTNPTAGRRLATAVMDGNVRYRARSYSTSELKPNQIQTELYLTKSEKMVFTDPGTSASGDDKEAVQQVHVIGTGRMLITDTRSKDETSATAKPDNAQPINFGGQGLTAFQWSDGLILDLTHGEMLMKGAVAMVHQPLEGDKVQLDCHDLTAEIKPADKSGGRKASQGGWLSEDAAKPELQRVWADGGIRIITGNKTVTCDHLLYEEAKREIFLWSDEPNVAVFHVEGQPTASKSSAFKWNRDTGTVEVLRLRSGIIPLRRSERDND